MATNLFTGKKELTNQKLRGGYYTPEVLAEYIVNWAIRTSTDTILEPSCGDGNFVIAAINKLKSNGLKKKASIIAVELTKEEIFKAKQRASLLKTDINMMWYNNDFFKVYKKLKNKKINVVIGNPPFIRFQNFDNESREYAFSLLHEVGYHPTKLSNTWSAFVQLSIELLSEGGRLAMVVPAEILQVQYAKELRQRITQQFEQITLVTFKKLVFSNIQQEVILLLAEGKRATLSSNCLFHTVEIENEDDLHSETLQKKISHADTKHSCMDVKWTSFFLNNEEFENLYLLNKDKKVKKLGEFASVNVGIVTGRNKFFILTDEVLKKYNLAKFSVPLVGKTNALNKLVFSAKDFNTFSKDNPAYMLKLQDVDEAIFNSGLKEYITLGEDEGVHLGYKCRIRKRWYDIPSTHISEGFLFRQIYKYPLLVANEQKAACTDTIHRVILKDKDIEIKQLAASFVNSLTFAWSEVAGRSYGGGVLELEPSEAMELPVLYTKDIILDTNSIDEMIRNNEIEKALDYVDAKLLIEYYSYSRKEVLLLRAAWEKLRDRRLYRSKA
ncbi:N-6 DNA methylase [Sulfurimonas sp.]